MHIKKLSLFLIKNKYNIKLISNFENNNLSIRMLAGADFFRPSDFKALFNMVRCFSILSNLKKTILIYNDNYVVIYSKKKWIIYLSINLII